MKTRQAISVLKPLIFNGLLFFVPFLLWSFSPPKTPDSTINNVLTLSSFPHFQDENELFEKKLKALFLNNLEENLVLSSIHHSRFATHYRYFQTFKGKIIIQSGITVHQFHDNSVIIQSYLFPTTNYILRDGNLPLLFPINGDLIPCEKIIRSLETDKKYVLNNAEGNTLYEFDYYRYFQVDTPVRGNVFMVNPVNSADTVYGGRYVDNNDANNEALQAELLEKVVPGRFRNDTFFLETDFIQFKEVTPPFIDTTHYSLSDSFFYNRSENGFESFNAYYHVHTLQNYVKSLHYDSLIALIAIDAHAMFGTDNSRFDPEDFTLEFGTGGVDDAEDGEVIAHEFAHSLSSKGSPSLFGDGIERISMEEGNCDYFAKSYSRSITTDVNAHKVFSWDGHNPFYPKAPVVNRGGIYPSALVFQANEDRSFWSSALMCAWDKMDREKMDELVLEHFYFQFSQATMPDMAEAILLIDSAIFSKQHHKFLVPCFHERKLTNRSVSVKSFGKIQENIFLNSYSFAEGTGNLTIKKEGNLEISIFSMDGKLMYATEGINLLNISPKLLNSGVYVIFVRNNQEIYTSKIIRF